MIVVGVVAVAAAERLHGGGPAWAAVAGVAALVGLVPAAGRPRAALTVGTALAAAALGVVLVSGAAAVRRIECCWVERRDALVGAAFHELRTTLEDAKTEVRRLADRGAAAAPLPREAQFELLAAAVSQRSGIERGVAVLDAAGRPRAWAGRHRFPPARDTSELRVVITPFYLSLEARRQTQVGGTAVATVLLDATPAVPDRAGALGVVFARRHGVSLRFFAPGTAPLGTDVFDYVAAGGDTLFSVRPQPPAQGDAKLAALARTAESARLLLAVLLVLMLWSAPPGRWRWMVVLVGAWALGRAGAGPALEPVRLLSPATFYRPALGPFGASAGAAAVLGVLLLIAAGALWRRGPRRRWWTVGPAAVLVLVAPFLVRYLGRGIAPPAGGVGFGLWLSWEAALATNSMALVLAAAALVRGPVEPRRLPWTLPVACLWATAAAIVGLWLWRPQGAWPEWYTYLWLPALAGALVPAPRRWVLFGIATVAGTAAALVTWNAALEGRFALAARDVRRLGRAGDAVAAALLERLGGQARRVAPPVAAGDLYGLWLESPLAADAYPTVLALWRPDGELRAELRLAALDLPAPVLATLARGAPRVERLERIPGVHYVLATRVASGDVLTVGVGPRSRLVTPDRVARFLRGEPVVEPPYAISLSLPGTALEAPSGYIAWTRAGWSARGDRRIDLPGGVRHVHVRVELRGFWALLLRGGLVVLLDLLLLAAAWTISVVTQEGVRVRLPGALAALRASYRARLTAALAGFFVLPVVAFALWGLARLGEEARRDGDLLIRETLRSAAVTAAAVAFESPAEQQRSVAALARRLEADLWMYRDGALAGASAPVLSELGLVDPFLDPAVYRRLALQDELEVAADGRTAGRAVRVGYRVVRAAPPGESAILAVPQLLDDEAVRLEREDLALALILAAVAGLGAAGLLAGAAARGLTEPIAALRDAALAVGRGAAPSPFPPGAPQEFAPVMSAFDRMASDVRRGHDALDEARRRTARVLANVATGVLAVDGELRVTLANARAEELLGTTLEPGVVLPHATPAGWRPVWDAVGGFLAARGEGIAERELEIDGRQVRVQLAALGSPPDGCVVALDDTTASTRAARVLAWGELARQVAHEIKNPLTPIRLGIQHLQRARKAGGRRATFDATLQETAARILAEIDRLDGIARAFARFGAPSPDYLPLESVELLQAAREVAQLYALGQGAAPAPGGAVQIEVVGEGAAHALARRDEMQEVLVNVLENARQAGARRVVVRVGDGGRRLTVEDDGRGIAPDVLARVFEPTFSTKSSGAGLGLAITRRLVESWGGTVTLASTPGQGTTVTLALRPPSGE